MATTPPRNRSPTGEANASPGKQRAIFESPTMPSPPEQSTISRLFLTPITFISFLISLFLIDAHNHRLRHSHSTHHAPPTTILGKIKAFLHRLVFKPTHTTPSSQSSSSGSYHDSPYAYISSPSNEKLGIVEPEGYGIKEASGNVAKTTGNGGEEKWYWHTKQKMMMRAEVADAFKIRKWVVVALVLGGGWVVIGVWVVAGWIGAVLGTLFTGGGLENRLLRDW